MKKIITASVLAIAAVASIFAGGSANACKTQLTKAGLAVDDTVFVSATGLNSNGYTITGVAAGTNDTDAVNVRQLNDAISKALAGMNNSNSIIHPAPQAVVPSQPAEAPQESVDLSELEGKVDTNTSGIADNKAAIEKNSSAIATNAAGVAKNSADISDIRSDLSGIHSDINRLDTRIDKVGANAAAISALHAADWDPDAKLSVAAGVGNYGSASAGAVGVFYRPNRDVTLSVASTFGTGENMVNAGVSVKIGSGSHHAQQDKYEDRLGLLNYTNEKVAKVEKENADLKAELAELKKAVAALQK